MKIKCKRPPSLVSILSQGQREAWAFSTLADRAMWSVCGVARKEKKNPKNIVDLYFL